MAGYIYLGFYSILIAAYLFRAKKKVNSILGSIILVIVISLIAISLADKSPDFLSYSNIYRWGSERMEPIYMLISKISHSLGFDYIEHLFVILLISCSLKILAISKLSTNFFLSVLVWLSNLFIMQEIIAIRTAVAGGLILLSIYYKYQKKYWLSAILFICSFGFHYTSLLCLPFLFVSNTTKFKWFYLLSIPISYYISLIAHIDLFVIFQFFDIDLVSTLYDLYDENVEGNPFNLVQLSRVFICYFLWWKIDKIKMNSSYVLCMLKMYTICCCLFPLFSSHVSVAIRSSELLAISTILLYPLLENCFSFSLKKFIPLIVCLTQLFYSFTIYLLG